MATKITYNSNIIATIESGQTVTLNCNGKKMTSDLDIMYEETATSSAETEDALVTRTITEYSNDRITYVGSYAFACCHQLTSFNLPNITKIGNDAFNHCTNLTNVTVPDGVTEIEAEAFATCDNLTSVTMGKGVTTLGSRVFSECPALVNVDFSQHTSIPALSTSAFYNHNSDLKILVPANLYYDWKAAENWSDYADYIVAPTFAAPTLSIANNILTITDTSGLAETYEIFIGGTQIETTSNTYDLSAHEWTEGSGTYSIYVIAKAEGYLNSVSDTIEYVVTLPKLATPVIYVEGVSAFKLMTVTLSGSGSSQVAVLSGLDTSKIYSVYCPYYSSSAVYQMSYTNGAWTLSNRYVFAIATNTSTSITFYYEPYDSSSGIYNGTTYEEITVLEGDELATLDVITSYDISGTYPIRNWEPCYVAGTQITLADGSTKNVENIVYSDELLVWNFDNGEYATANPLWIKKPQTTNYYYDIQFESGNKLKLIGSNSNCHRLYSIEDGEFIYANLLVGKEVYTEHGFDKVVSCEVVNEPVEFYNIITDYHMNCFANKTLTSCRYNNIYPISNMKFVKDDRNVVPFEAYNVSIEYYNGMRLGEQTIDIEKTNAYVEKLVNLKKEEMA